MSDPIRRLDEATKEAVRSAARLQLQHFRGLASAAVRRRARLLAAGGRVDELEAHEFGASARVNDDGSIGRVLLLWDDAEAGRCSCSAFARRATCAHTIALLDALIAALGGSVKTASNRAGSEPEPADSTSLEWLARIERYRDAIDESRTARRTGAAASSADDDPWKAAGGASVDVRYAMRFVDRRGGPVAQLEAQIRPSDAAATAPWRTVPFTESGRRKGVDIASLGDDHAAVAAVASGVPDGSWYLESVHREVTLARVQRAIADPLLTAAARASEVVFLGASKSDAGPLMTTFGDLAALELEADDETREVWTIRGHIAIGRSRRVPAEDIAGASTDGLVVLRHGGNFELVLLDAPSAVPIALDLSTAPLNVPREDAETLSVLSGVARLVGDGLRHAARPVEPVACLRVEAPLHGANESQNSTPQRGRAGVRMECTLHFDYAGTRVRFDDATSMVQTLDGRATPRQRAFEQASMARFFELGGRRTRTEERQGCDASIEGTTFLGMAATLVDEGWRVTAQDYVLKAPSAVSVNVKSGVDWFDLEGGVTFGDEVVPFPRVLDAANGQRGYVTLDDGSHGLLPDAWLRRWSAASIGEDKGDAIRFDQSQAWVLSMLVDRVTFDRGDPLAPLRESLAALTQPHPTSPTEDFVGELRPYQREGLGWLLHLDRVGLSGCLADDMGLGKTVQMLAYLLHRREGAVESGRHFLVVAPKSLTFNWIAECERFAPEVPTVEFSGPGRWPRLERAQPGSLVVTTYGTLRRDAAELAKRTFDVVVLDEAQAIKNRASQTTKAVRVLNADRRVALTGTPIENHLGELWSLLDFLNPKMLGAASVFERLGAPRSSDDLIDEGRELLARALRPFLLRRKKDDVLRDLPPKTEQILRAPLAGAQRAAYSELTRYYQSELSKSKGQRKREKFEDPTKFDLNVLAALTRLRQCACHPGLVDRELIAERSGKLDLVLPMLTDIARSGGKAIVFSSFTKLLGLVRTQLETERVPYVTLDGGTTDRQSPVQRFQESEDGMVFLISIKAGGSGLNLTAADYVFLLDPWWNPAVEAQAIDRAHRIGRTRPVHVYRVLTEETVEAHVVELQEKKRELTDAILGGAPSALAELTRDDLAFLLH